jgi:hypothetical protein
MENVRPVAQTEKAIAELTAEQDLIDDSLSSGMLVHYDFFFLMKLMFLLSIF